MSIDAVLRDDALVRVASGHELRVGLPWIRSLPLSCVSDLQVAIDSRPVPVRARLGGAAVPLGMLRDESRWWYVQDRLVLIVDAPVADSARVEVSFSLTIPYLGGPDGPIVLPFRSARALTVRAAPSSPAASRDVA